MKRAISYLVFHSLIVAAFVLPAFGQSLPQGEWHLIAYNFKEKVAYPIDKNVITLKVRPDGKLGGNSGCNAYGGSYAIEDGRLRISDIISTMRACAEPSPDFEYSFFKTLGSATEFSSADRKLTITDPKTKNFLRFELIEKKPALR